MSRSLLTVLMLMPMLLLMLMPLLAPLQAVNALIAGEEKLVPAQFNPRHDSGANSWDIQSQGTVNNGTNDCFDSGMVLMVNGHHFNPNNPNGHKQTEDGNELVLTGLVNQISITRRILVDAKRQTVRYLELVTNTGKTPQKVALEIRSQLGSQTQQSVWNDGKPAVAGALPKKCVALGAIHQPGDQRPGVVWLIGDSRASVPPTVDIHDQYLYMTRYALDIPAQKTVAVLHYVLQRPNLVSAQLPEVIKPLWRGALIKPVIPAAFKRLVCNFRSGTTTGEDEPEQGPRLPVIAALLERAGIDDTGSKTLVGVGRSEAERMTGSLLGGPLVATSEFGAVTVTVDELAGAEGSGFRTLLHLRNGETIAAQTLTGTLRLETEVGVELPVDPTQVAWLVAKRTPSEGTAPADQLGVVLLTDGSRIAVSTMTPPLPVISAYGQAAVAFDQLANIERVNEPPGWLVTMRDGSRLRVLPAAKEISVATCRFAVLKLLTARIAGYQRSGKPVVSEDADEREDGAQLDNGERFFSGLAGTTLTINANGTNTAIPIERITAIERPEDSAGLAVILRDGGRLVGTTTDGTIALLAGGQTWRVPVRRLLQWQAPKPPEQPEPEEKPEPEENEDEKKDEETPAGFPAPTSAPPTSFPALTSDNPFGVPSSDIPSPINLEQP